MYIPLHHRRGGGGGWPGPVSNAEHVPVTTLFSDQKDASTAAWKQLNDDTRALIRRQFSSNPSDNTNIQIGLVVGIVLGAFIVGLCIFLYISRHTIRFRRRRRRSVRKTSSSKSSKSSDAEAPPPPADAPPPPDAPPEGA